MPQADSAAASPLAAKAVAPARPTKRRRECGWAVNASSSARSKRSGSITTRSGRRRTCGADPSRAGPPGRRRARRAGFLRFVLCEGTQPDEARRRPRGPALLGSAPHVRRRPERSSDRSRALRARAGRDPSPPSRTPRRRFVGRAGASAFAASGLAAVCACGIEGTLRRPEGRDADPDGHPPEGPDRQLDVLELAALHRQEGPQGLRQGVRRPCQVRRGDQRQRRVLRQGPPAAAAGQVDRARHRDADRLHGREVGPQPLRPGVRQEERPELLQEPRGQLQGIPYDPKRQFTAPWQSGATGSGTTRRRPGAS